MITGVTVFSKPNCSACEGTYTILRLAKIDYEVVDVTQSEAAVAYVTEDLGYSAAPIVVVDFDAGEQDHWSGLRVDKIQQLKQHVRSL